MTDGPSVQERYAPQNHCFGCGPANPKGLRIRSFEDGEGGLRAEWTPQPHHEAFDGMLNGGIIGSLMDCHGNWAAALHIMKARGEETPPCTVTAEFHVKLKRVTPSDGPVRPARAGGGAPRTTGPRSRWSWRPEGKTTSTCRGVFVAVREGHPAYHRW